MSTEDQYIIVLEGTNESIIPGNPKFTLENALKGAEQLNKFYDKCRWVYKHNATILKVDE